MIVTEIARKWLNADKWALRMAQKACRGCSEKDAASNLRAAVEDSMPDLGPSMAEDLLRNALAEVDWETLSLEFRE